MAESEERELPFWPVMTAIFFGSFVAILGISTINVAIPVLVNDFHTDLNTVQWTLTGFMLATGVIAPVTGYLGDKFSTKYLYIGALAGFTLLSALCAAAWNIESLIVFRILQGAFCGIIMPATMTIVYQVVPKEKQAFALSLWSLSAMLAPAVGPTLAGFLIQSFSWEWLFLLNVPFGIISVLVAVKLIPYYRMSRAIGFDMIGLLTVILSSTSLLVAFSEGHAWGWTSRKIVSLLGLGVLILCVFVWRELKAENPLLNLKVFQSKKYTFSLILSCMITISLYSGTYLTPVFLQNIQRMSALDTGLILFPASLAMAIFMPITGKLYRVVGPIWLMTAGILMIGIGTWKMGHLSVEVSHGYIMFWMAVRNVGISLSTMPATNLGMSDIPRTLSGHASSVNNWIRQGMGSFSIGLFTSLLTERMSVHVTEMSAGAAKPSSLIQQKAFTSSVNDVYFVATVIVLFALPVVAALIRRRRPSVQVQAQSAVRDVQA